MSDSKKLPGHLAALFCTLVWGTTFISTKVLLRDFNPIEILFFRFALGFAALWLACPHALRLTERKQEWLFAGAGLAGVTLYFLLENIALTHTFASNVGVIVAVSPFFTALLSFWLLKAEKPGLNFLLGFAAAIGRRNLLQRLSAGERPGLAPAFRVLRPRQGKHQAAEDQRTEDPGEERPGRLRRLADPRVRLERSESGGRQLLDGALRADDRLVPGGFRRPRPVPESGAGVPDLFRCSQRVAIACLGAKTAKSVKG